MAAAYSMDLRERVLKDAEAGLSSKELAERYHVSRAWVDALKQRLAGDGIPRASPQTKFRARVLRQSGEPAGGADHRAAGCDADGITRRAADHGGTEHAVAGDRRLGFTVKKNGTRRRTTSA